MRQDILDAILVTFHILTWMSAKEDTMNAIQLLRINASHHWHTVSLCFLFLFLVLSRFLLVLCPCHCHDHVRLSDFAVTTAAWGHSICCCPKESQNRCTKKKRNSLEDKVKLDVQKSKQFQMWTWSKDWIFTCVCAFGCCGPCGDYGRGRGSVRTTGTNWKMDFFEKTRSGSSRVCVRLCLLTQQQLHLRCGQQNHLVSSQVEQLPSETVWPSN